MNILPRLVLASSVLALSACHLFTAENLPKTILTLKDIACIAENAFVNDAKLNLICNLLTAEQQQAAREVAQATRAGVAKAQASMLDGGVDAGSTDASLEGGKR